MDLQRIEKFIARRKISFICSVDEEGFPAVKAMLRPRLRTGLREFWFSTNTSSMRVGHFRNDPKASVYFYRKGLFSYTGVLLTGTMEVLTDQDSKNRVWKKGDTLYYKGGVTDPDYCVLRFTARKGRYYRDLKSEDFDI